MSCTLGLVQHRWIRETTGAQCSCILLETDTTEMTEANSPSFGLTPLYFCDKYHEEQLCAAYVSVDTHGFNVTNFMLY